MEVNNVKLDWSAIFENEISYYEKVLDSSNIREMYSGIIAMLDQNNLKSRVITDGTRVLGLGNVGPEASLPVMEGKGNDIQLSWWCQCNTSPDPGKG